MSEKFWRFIPIVSRPWNPAYSAVWDKMTHREKQKSFLFDVVLIIIVGIFLWYFL
jgi:hypothetical protein